MSKMILNRDTSNNHDTKRQKLCKLKYVNINLTSYSVVKYLYIAGINQVNETPKPKRKRPGFFKEIFLIYKYG